MSDQSLRSPIKVICFDIGGVLAHVNLTWAGAMRSAGLEPTVAEGGRLEDCHAFIDFQNGLIPLEKYLLDLAEYLQIEPRLGLEVHDGILDRPTEGTLEIVNSLIEYGLKTACLSNTNQPHWEVLTDPIRFPNIARLQLKRASQIYGVSKPDHKIYRLFESDAEAEPHQILFFEDNYANYQAALDCGWHCALIDPRAPQDKQIVNSLSKFGIALRLSTR